MRLRHLFSFAIVVAAPASAQDRPVAKAVPAIGAVPAPGEKLRCKVMPVTGSLAQTRKVCLTERGWRAQNDSARGMIDRGHACSNRTNCSGN